MQLFKIICLNKAKFLNRFVIYITIIFTGNILKMMRYDGDEKLADECVSWKKKQTVGECLKSNDVPPECIVLRNTFFECKRTLLDCVLISSSKVLVPARIVWCHCKAPIIVYSFPRIPWSSRNLISDGDYNKKEDDFNTLEEYNDYLEEIKTIIFNLCNNIEILNTNKCIEAYRRENRDVIQRNKARIGREEYELEQMLEAKRVHEARHQDLLTMEIEQKKKKEREKEALVDELMTSGKNAKAIVSEFVEKVEKLREEEKKVPLSKLTTEFSTGIKFGRSNDTMFLSVPKSDDGPLYVHEIPMMYMEGPQAPGHGHWNKKLYDQRTLACQGALQEAMQGLYQASLQSINRAI